MYLFSIASNEDIEYCVDLISRVCAGVEVNRRGRLLDEFEGVLIGFFKSQSSACECVP